MNFKYTPNTLKKLEELFEEGRYIIRYEKGTFNSGYCILEDRRIVVINKFFNVEGRINALIEILQSVAFTEEELSGDGLKLYRQLKSQPTAEDEATIETETDQ